MKPLLRYGHTMLHFDSGQTIIGSITIGLAQSFNDPDGEICKLLNELLNGEHTFDDVSYEFSVRSRYTLAQAKGIIRQLYNAGHIEDAEKISQLSKKECVRYSRSANYFAWVNKDMNPSHWHAQEKLNSSKVVVLGVGGIGGEIAYHLASSGVGSLVLIDCDKVELSNLNRQALFTEQDVGKEKVDVAVRRLREINSDVEIQGRSLRIMSHAAIAKLIEGASLFFRCADSPDDMPYWASDAALLTGVPWVDCTYAGPVIQCCTFVPGSTGCYRCLRESEKRIHEADGQGEIYSDHVPEGNPAFGPVVHAAGSLAAYEGIRFLTGLHPRSIGRAIHQNMVDYTNAYAVTVPDGCTHRNAVA